ncbi:MAG: hypothetical protein PUP92_13955 [Rhizonema sp. PD38]|nr:hypothetical protein [Rhizonema sp. PD38]
MKNSKLTGHPIVDAIASISFAGNITPPSWFHHIVYTTAKSSVTKCDMLAVQILSDLVFWYRPYEKRHELTGESLGWRKKFAEEHLRRSPDALSKIFNTSVKCVRESIKVLVNLGLITVILKPVKTVFGVFPNVMHITLIPERIAQITHQMREGETAETIEKSLLPKKDTCSTEGVTKQVLNKEHAATEQESYLYIENSIKNSTEISLPSLSPQPANQEKRENQFFGFQIPKVEDLKLESTIDSSVLPTKTEATQSSPDAKSAGESTLPGEFRGRFRPADFALEIESQSVETVSLVAKNENNSQVIKKYDPYFPSHRATPNENRHDWLNVDDPWVISEGQNRGKLVPEFHEAVAQKWLGRSGDKFKDIHEAKAAVRQNFKKDRDNVEIEWEWYHSKFIHKAANIETRRLAGIDTTLEEIEIMKHVAAAQPVNETHSATVVRSPEQVVSSVAPYTLSAVLGAAVGVTESIEAYTKTARPEDVDFWSNPEAIATEASATVGASQSRARAFVENLKAARQIKVKRVEIKEETFIDAHTQMLEDMRKRLKSGIDTMRLEAIAWVADIDNGCELVVENGKAIDIKEIDF